MVVMLATCPLNCCKQAGEHHQPAAQRNPALHVEPAAIGEQDDQAQLRQDLRHRREQRQVQENALLLVRDLPVGLLEAPDLMRLRREALDGLHPADAFREEQHQAVVQLAVAQVGGPQPARVIVRDPPKRARDRQARQRQRRLNPPHEHEIDRQRQQHVDPLQDHAIDEQARVLHVARHPVEDRAGAVHVEEAEAQPLQFVIHPVAQVGDDLPLRQPGGGHVVVVGQHRPQQGLRDNRQRHHRDGLQRSPARRGPPAKRIHRRPLRRVERVADDVNDHPQQLEPRQAEQQQRHAQHQRPQAIAAELPRQGQQTPHQFAGGIPALVVFAGRRIRT